MDIWNRERTKLSGLELVLFNCMKTLREPPMYHPVRLSDWLGLNASQSYILN
jgi:hypothetical protein